MTALDVRPILATGDQPQEVSGHDYTAEGKRAPAYLDEEWVPSTWPDEDFRTRFEESPVALSPFLPYPKRLTCPDREKGPFSLSLSLSSPRGSE